MFGFSWRQATASPEPSPKRVFFQIDGIRFVATRCDYTNERGKGKIGTQLGLHDDGVVISISDFRFFSMLDSSGYIQPTANEQEKQHANTLLEGMLEHLHCSPNVMEFAETTNEPGEDVPIIYRLGDSIKINASLHKPLFGQVLRSLAEYKKTVEQDEFPSPRLHANKCEELEALICDEFHRLEAFSLKHQTMYEASSPHTILTAREKVIATLTPIVNEQPAGRTKALEQAKQIIGNLLRTMEKEDPIMEAQHVCDKFNSSMIKNIAQCVLRGPDSARTP